MNEGKISAASFIPQGKGQADYHERLPYDGSIMGNKGQGCKQNGEQWSAI